MTTDCSIIGIALVNAPQNFARLQLVIEYDASLLSAFCKVETDDTLS
jgi:hypothetical protein